MNLILNTWTISVLLRICCCCCCLCLFLCLYPLKGLSMLSWAHISTIQNSKLIPFICKLSVKEKRVQWPYIYPPGLLKHIAYCSQYHGASPVPWCIPSTMVHPQYLPVQLLMTWSLHHPGQWECSSLKIMLYLDLWMSSS